MNRFIQIHCLTSYPAALLNRDDAGFAKRIPFGGASRTRISSQCLKRHWRTFEGEHSLSEVEVPPSIRSRQTFERRVVRPLIDEDGLDQTLVRLLTNAMVSELLGESEKAKKSKAEGGENGAVETKQVTVIGQPEIEFVRSEIRELCRSNPKLTDAKDAAKKGREAVKARLGKEGRKNLQALRHSAGLSAALFGRMVTSDILSRTDAAVHVSHAFTVHKEASESDYFSAVDDLLQREEGELGSGHINSTELTSGLYYLYVVVDVPLLISNLEGCGRQEAQKADRSLAADIVSRLVHLVATVSPGAKLGSTAPYAHAHMVLVEAGKAQPRTLANAFLRPVAETPDVLANTYRALAQHLTELDTMYGRSTERKLAGIGPIGPVLEAIGAEPVPVAGVADWAAGIIRG
jgi:CRISPR system Cascade subunit CasC